MKPTPEQVEDWTVLRTEVGSRVLGVSVAETDDRDLLAIAVEPLSWVVGASAPVGEPRAWQYRTKADGSPQPEGARSGPGDVDLAVHPLRKWVRLALGGNPTVLMSLYAPPDAVERNSPLGALLRVNASRFVSLRAKAAFSGYLAQQEAGLRGTRKTKTNRPELVERYGFDTKFAYHALRLGIQGVEFLTTGHIALPMTPDNRAYLLAVREGGYGLAEVLRAIEHYKEALDATDAPAQPDVAWASRVVEDAYRRAWDVED